MKSLHANPLSSTTPLAHPSPESRLPALVTLLALGCTSKHQSGTDGLQISGARRESDILRQTTPGGARRHRWQTQSGWHRVVGCGKFGLRQPHVALRALKQVTAKYPVTLYTTSNCGPCDAGRAVLAKRGVPFSEKSIVTNEDIGAFSRITKDNTLPYLTIGGQQIKRFHRGRMVAIPGFGSYPEAVSFATKLNANRQPNPCHHSKLPAKQPQNLPPLANLLRRTHPKGTSQQTGSTH